MSCSPARLAANRANALKSTGPRTDEGKERSRANALKHGLCAAVVVAEDPELLTQRTVEWYEAIKPQTQVQSWLVDKIAVYSLRIDRAHRMERRLRDRKSMIAEFAWEDDRRLEAEVLGSKIADRPAEVVERLRRTPAGCDWLLGRWAMFAKLAEVNDGAWTPEQTTLAFHLTGTPLELRDGLKPGDWVVDEEGGSPENVEDLASLARRESAELLERRQAVTPVDEVDRALTEADLFDDNHPELRRLRRHESALHGQLRWCLAQFQYESPHHRPHPDLDPKWRVARVAESSAAQQQADAAALAAATFAAAAAATTAVDVSRSAPKEPLTNREQARMTRPAHPPFCLKPDEIPADLSKIDIGAIAISREVKRLKKAEDRREARRKKLERLRN